MNRNLQLFCTCIFLKVNGGISTELVLCETTCLSDAFHIAV